jgi:hypothetical protein
MKKIIAAAMFMVLVNPLLHGMKRTILADSLQPTKKCRIESKVVQVEQISPSCMRSLAFDSFMIVQKTNQRMSEQEVQDLRKNFVLHDFVDRDNPHAILLKSYYDTMSLNRRIPVKYVRENGEIYFL